MVRVYRLPNLLCQFRALLRLCSDLVALDRRCSRDTISCSSDDSHVNTAAVDLLFENREDGRLLVP